MALPSPLPMHTSLPFRPESLARRHRLRRLLAFGIALVLGLFLIPTGRADLVVIDRTKITNHIVFTNDTVILTNGVVIPMPAVSYPSPVSRKAGSLPIQLDWGMPLPIPVTVSLQITGGTAISGTDYLEPAPIGFPVVPGSVSTVLPITLLNPPTIDPAADIRFTITLIFPDLPAIALAERAASISEDVPIDPPGPSEYSFGSIFISGIPIPEGAPPTVINVNRTGDLSTPGSVRVSSTPGTGTPGVDYGIVDLVLQFPPGICCQPVSVVAFPDSVADPGEAFSLQLSNPVGGILGTNPFQTFFVIDVVKTNPPTPTNIVFFASDPVIRVARGDGPIALPISVQRTPADNGTASVQVTTVNGTAVAVEDFSPINQSLSFSPGINSGVLTLLVFPAPGSTTAESFTVQLSGPANAVLGSPAAITIQIDPPPLSADLSLTGSLAPSPVGVGEEFTINTTVINGGPATAPAVIVSAPFPAEADFLSATPPGVYNPGTGVWSVGSLPPGTSRTLTIRVRARAAGERTLPHEIIGADVPDPDSVPGNGLPGEDDIAFVQFKADEKLADLTLSMEARPPQTNITDKITFVVTLRNYGLDPAKDIRVINRLPAGLQLDSHKVSAGAFAPATGTWTVPALATDATATLELVVKTTRGGSYTNVATIEASAPRDPTDSNNRAEAVATFNGHSICGIAKVCWTGSGVPNTNATVTLDGPHKLTTRTDSLGTFCFTNLPPGKYKVTVVAADATLGIVDWTQDVDIVDRSVEVYPDSRWLAIVGRVTSGSSIGPPVGGIEIEATAPGEAKRTVKTDANGEYRFYKLANKKYTLQPINLPGLIHLNPGLRPVSRLEMAHCRLMAQAGVPKC